MGKRKIDQRGKDFSKLAAGSYDYETDRSQHTAGTDYVLHPNANFSDHSMTTYVHKNDPSHIVIAHRGTAPGSKGGRGDITTDLAFATGYGGDRQKMNNRMKKTEDIIRQTGAKEVHLTGHSLGGGTVNHSIANSAYIRSKLTSAHTYNAAANPIFANKQNVSKKNRKALEGKVTHHRIEDDAVSAGFKTNTPFGKVKTYKQKRSTGQKLLTAVSPFAGTAKRSLDNHSLSNFHGEPG